MIIVPPKTMSDNNIKMLRDNGICVVVSKDPNALKFVDPIPAISNRTEIENAAIQLTRRLFAGDLFADNRRDFAKLYMDCLIKGTPLDPAIQMQKVEEKRIYDSAYYDEVRRLAREDAKKEREAKKAEAAKTA